METLRKLNKKNYKEKESNDNKLFGDLREHPEFAQTNYKL
jgi:hypothetical protein